jgi:gamma-glutamyl:cysteine ligase YbdK (ATP-grasp superfamily)
MTPQQHVYKLFPQAQKHADHYGVAYMICTMDDGEDRGWHIRPLSYADDVEFEAFDGVVELVIEPRETE